MVGCLQGKTVRGSSESLNKELSSSNFRNYLKIPELYGRIVPIYSAHQVRNMNGMEVEATSGIEPEYTVLQTVA